MDAKLFQQNLSGVGFTFGNAVVYQEYWLNSWRNHKSLLDIGCGLGINTLQALARAGQTCVSTKSRSAMFH